MLFEVVLSFEGFAANLAGEGHVILVAALVDHEVVGLGEASLAVLADELDGALGSHLLPAAELPAVPLCLHWHYREHPYKFPPLPRYASELSRLSLLPFSAGVLSLVPPCLLSRFVSVSPPAPSLSRSTLRCLSRIAPGNQRSSSHVDRLPVNTSRTVNVFRSCGQTIQPGHPRPNTCPTWGQDPFALPN